MIGCTSTVITNHKINTTHIKSMAIGRIFGAAVTTVAAAFYLWQYVQYLKYKCKQIANIYN